MSNLPPPMPPDTSPGFPVAPKAPKASWWNHKAWKLPVWGWIVAGVIGLTAIGAAAGSKNQDNVASSQGSTPATTDSITPATAATTTTVAVTTTAPSTTVPPTTAAATTTAAPATTQQAPVTTQPARATTQPAPGSDLTPSQQAVVRSAQSYLEFMGPSRQGRSTSSHPNTGPSTPLSRPRMRLPRSVCADNLQRASERWPFEPDVRCGP